MARIWWTTMPDKYYLKSTSRGGRNAVLFAALGKIKNSFINKCHI
jgi:hypothetical protein